MGPGRARNALLTCLAAVLLPACLATPPRHAVETIEGVVRAEQIEQARITARLLDDMAPEVRRLLPDTRPDPIEIWIQPELEIYDGWPVDRDVPAFTIETMRRIHVVEGDPQHLSAALGHELVHSMLGPTWETLPPVAEEGLADWVQEQLHPGAASLMRADHLAKASAAVGGLEFGLWCPWPILDGRRLARIQFFLPDESGEVVDPRRALDTPSGASSVLWQPYEVSVSDPRLYGVGYLVVSRCIERIGISGLHALCVEARKRGLEQVPAEWLLEPAGLTGDDDSWRLIIAERLGVNELLALARSIVPELVALVAELRPRVRSESGEQFLREYQPNLGVVDGGLRIPLESIPGFRRELYSAWPTSRTLADRVTDPTEAVRWSAPASTLGP